MDRGLGAGVSNLRGPRPDIDADAGTFDRRASAYRMHWPAPTPPTVRVRRTVLPEDETSFRRGREVVANVWEYDVPCPVCPAGAPPIRLAWRELVPIDLINYTKAEAAREHLEQQRRHEVEVARLTTALEVSNRERAALRSKVVKQGHQRSKRFRGY